MLYSWEGKWRQVPENWIFPSTTTKAVLNLFLTGVRDPQIISFHRLDNCLLKVRKRRDPSDPTKKIIPPNYNNYRYHSKALKIFYKFRRLAIDCDTIEDVTNEQSFHRLSQPRWDEVFQICFELLIPRIEESLGKKLKKPGAVSFLTFSGYLDKMGKRRELVGWLVACLEIVDEKSNRSKHFT